MLNSILYFFLFLFASHKRFFNFELEYMVHGGHSGCSNGSHWKAYLVGLLCGFSQSLASTRTTISQYSEEDEEEGSSRLVVGSLRGNWPGSRKVVPLFGSWSSAPSAWSCDSTSTTGNDAPLSVRPLCASALHLLHPWKLSSVCISFHFFRGRTRNEVNSLLFLFCGWFVHLWSFAGFHWSSWMFWSVFKLNLCCFWVPE